jgi:hypothetical protein
LFEAAFALVETVMLKKFGSLPALILMLAIMIANPACLALDRSAEIPKAALNIPPMVKEESLSTYLPSESAPGQGLALNLMYSAKPRYKEGAPVLVVVPGGQGSQGLDFDMHAAQQGFVELRFAFPGGGKPGFMSSGIYDNRGIKSQEAVRDVLRFAAGEIPDCQGRKISELFSFHLANKTIGAVGWSNGGNTLLVTLGKFGEQLPFVKWLAFYESPVGSMFYPPALGGAQDMLMNKHYRQGTGATGQVIVDFRNLAYQAGVVKDKGARKKGEEPGLPGVAFFDENANGTWDETSEFAIPYSTDVGFDKQIYAPPVTRALFNLPRFQPPKTPKKKSKSEPAVELPFASYDESLAFYRERDGSLYIKQVVEQHPDMAVSIFAGRLDHLQRQPDHPHIAMLYNTFLAAKPKFVRLNPSSAYVGTISFMKAATFAENRPNTSVEADLIDQYLEPQGLLPVYAYMDAAVSELSDRVYTNKWTKMLEAPLINYSNGAKPPEPPGSKGKSAAAGKETSGADKSGADRAGFEKAGTEKNSTETTGAENSGTDSPDVDKSGAGTGGPKGKAGTGSRTGQAGSARATGKATGSGSAHKKPSGRGKSAGAQKGTPESSSPGDWPFKK